MEFFKVPVSFAERPFIVGETGPKKPCPQCGAMISTTRTQDEGQWLLEIKVHQDARLKGFSVCSGSGQKVC